MTISLTGIFAAYLAAGAWYTHGVVTDVGDAGAEDRLIISDGLIKSDPAAIFAVGLFVLAWMPLFIWSRISNK
jgi:hypothetical protein